MSDDSYCLFIIVTCLIALILPTPAGEVLYTLIAIPIVWLARVPTEATAAPSTTRQPRPREGQDRGAA
jgi:hypothetical protein